MSKNNQIHLAKSLMKKFNSLKSYGSQIDFLIKNKDYFVLVLDNDEMYIRFDIEEMDLTHEEYELMYDFSGNFKYCVGLSDGIFVILDRLGIKSEVV